MPDKQPLIKWPNLEFLGRFVGPLIVLVIAGGLLWEAKGNAVLGPLAKLDQRAIEGQYYGRHRAPVEGAFTDPVWKTFAPPPPGFKLMSIRHIPLIRKGDPMPHPYVGACKHCHLYYGGPGPGNQFKTPVGAVLEKMSQVHKLGPPLKPNSQIPHPPAGRCIKCHDIVVKVPVKKKKGGFLWQL